MRVFEIKYLGPTNFRGGRLRVTELRWGERLRGAKSFGYPHHINSGESKHWALSQYLGLGSHGDPVIRTRSVKVQTDANTHIIVIELP